MADEDDHGGHGLHAFATYEDYLDKQITETDKFYLEVRVVGGARRWDRAPNCGAPPAQDEELARQLIELGYRGSGETLKREEFEARKRAEREKHVQKVAAPKQLASAGKDLSRFPFLQALANREELVRNGKLTVRRKSPSRAPCGGRSPHPPAPVGPPRFSAPFRRSCSSETVTRRARR